MTRVNHILIGLIILGLSVSLFLYHQSRTRSDLFLERTNTVKEVLLLLERTEKLKNILRKTAYDRNHIVDSAIVFTTQDKSEIDSILHRLHNIVLYDEQRERIDSIAKLINYNYDLLLKSNSAVPYYKGVSNVLLRARYYAEKRLHQQQKSYDDYQDKVTLWVNSILVTSFCLFVAGIWSTVYERRSKAKLKHLHEAILTSSNNGVCVFEVSRAIESLPKLLFSNAGAVVHRRSGSEQVLGLSSSVFNDSALMEAVNQVYITGQSIIKEYEYMDNDTSFWFLITISRIGQRNVVMNYQDISPLKQYETDLRSRVNELESVNRDLEQFAHATSHDLKEPFRKIQIMGDRLISGYKKDNHHKYLESIVKAADKGSQLVEHILNYSKVQFDRSQLTIVDLNQVIANVKDDLEIAILEKKACIEVDKLPVIKANRVQMLQLFLNLLANALKFSTEERSPMINVSCVEISGFEVPDLNSETRYYAISVEDNGIGFDATYSQKIFIAFERLNSQQVFPGFGLGLSLCKRIVLNHDGAITARSKAGEGSTFTIYLPIDAGVKFV